MRRIELRQIEQRDLLPNFRAIRLGNPPTMRRLKYHDRRTIELLDADLSDTFAFDERQGRP